jgi:enterochelin esterase-like enzyme
MTRQEQPVQTRSRISILMKSIRWTALLVGCFLLFCVRDIFAQDMLLPNKVEVRDLEGGKTRTYSIALKDGDYASFSISQPGKAYLTIVRPDGSLMRRFPEPSGDAEKDYAFSAEGAGTYSFNIINPAKQTSHYELKLESVLSLNERLRPNAAWIDPNPSPRIEALRQQVIRDHVSTDAFWKQVAQEGTPLVESFGTDGAYQLVTFLWRETYETRNVLVLGSLSVPGTARMDYVMHRLADTDLWYWTVKLPRGARFSYRLSPNDPLVLDGPRAEQRAATVQSDPLNPHRLECGPDATRFACRSLAALPGAPPQPWLVKKVGTPEGKVEARTIHSNIQKLDREISIYTPAGYTPNGTTNRLLVLFDGDEYLSPQMGITVTMDNLIAAHKIPPTVVLLVFNPDGRRLKDLVANPEFADSMAKEIIPWVWAKYNVTHGAAQTAVGGYSAGGLAANYMALRYSNIFGNVINQSGAVWWSPEQGIYDRAPSVEGNWMARQFADGPKLPVKFYIEAGAFEFDSLGRGGDILESSRELRDVLQAKGNEVHYHQFVGGHDALTWPGTIADAIIELLGN